jgi:hypothetical protein
MEYLENDMDHLFQKAGELYPLKTSEPDWKTVIGKLNEEGFGTQAIPGMTAKRNRNKRRWLFLLFLIPLGLGSISYFSVTKIHQEPNSPNINIKNNTKKQSGEVAVKPTIQNVPANHSLNNQTTVNNIILQNESINRKILKSSGNTIPGNNQRDEVKRSVSGNKQDLVVDNARKNKNETYTKGLNSSIIVSEIINDNLAISQTHENNQLILQKPMAEKPVSIPVSGLHETISVEARPLASTPSKTLNGAPTVTNSKKQNNSSSAKGFYVGFLGGPDLSAVKFQSVKQLGLSLGLIAGYRINKKFAVETGLIWDKKYYYSSGEYFNKNEINLPAYTSILTVNGSCNMLEIPISLRYDFPSRANHGFFVKGGFSSYLMKQENYTAKVDSSGSQWSYPFATDHPKNYIFSIAELSGGYEFAIDRKTKISFEPYVKIPLQGIGVGSMPISSAGIYIGISYSFH